MNTAEMLQKMSEAGGFGKSKLHMRSESAQKGVNIKRIPRLKKGLKKKSKLLVIADLALPFNPATGTEDGEFNADNKFRPPYSATSVALMLKASADTNESLKKELMRRAGVEEWDTSDSETLNAEDRVIFNKYRVPRIFTVPVVHVNIPAMTKSSFGRDYAISVQYDDTGEIIGEKPGVLKVNKLFKDKIYEEIQEYQGRIDSGEIKRTDQQQKDDKGDIYKKNPVSDVHPSNWLTAIELPLTSNYELSGDVDYKNFTAQSAEQALVMFKYSHNAKDGINKYVDGSYKKFDVYFDYFCLDMSCPVEGDDTTDTGKMQIGLHTQFEKPTNNLTDDGMLDEEQFKTVSKAITEYLDGCEDIEVEVRRSMFTPPYTEDVENQIFTTLNTVLDISDPYLTQKVLLENREVISIAFAGVGSELLDEIDAGISEKEAGALDVEASASVAKEYSLEDAEFQDSTGDVALEEVELAE